MESFLCHCFLMASTATPPQKIARQQNRSATRLSAADRRLLAAAYQIRTVPPHQSCDKAYMARQLVQVTLPHRNPGDVPVPDVRRSSNAPMRLTSRVRSDSPASCRKRVDRRTCVGTPWAAASSDGNRNRTDQRRPRSDMEIVGPMQFLIRILTSFGWIRTRIRKMCDQR